MANEVVAVTDVGAHSDNVLVDDERRLRFIDPLIRLKRPAAEVLEYLVGDVWQATGCAGESYGEGNTILDISSA